MSSFVWGSGTIYSSSESGWFAQPLWNCESLHMQYTWAPSTEWTIGARGCDRSLYNHQGAYSGLMWTFLPLAPSVDGVSHLALLLALPQATSTPEGLITPTTEWSSLPSFLSLEMSNLINWDFLQAYLLKTKNQNRILNSILEHLIRCLSTNSSFTYIWIFKAYTLKKWLF